MPNDAKTKLDQATHRFQDQPTTAEPVGIMKSEASEDAAQRQPPQAQQRDTTGTTLPDPHETSNEENGQITGD